MYNRYIPQSDGSFLRSKVAEPEAEPRETIPDIVPEAPLLSNHPTRSPNRPGSEKANRTSMQMRNMQSKNPYHMEQNTTAGSVGSFLKGLLPQNFDTEDLIVVLLLLLISGNNAKDQNAALMTLGIYLFL